MGNKNVEVSLNIDELKDFMKHIVDNNRFLQKGGKKPVAVEVVGNSGIGKTSTVLQIAKELGLNFVKLNLAQIEEVGDLVGFPVKEFEVVKVKGDDIITKWIPESVIPAYIQSGYKPTERRRMSHAAPEWIEGCKEGGMLILDDWNRADVRFIQAVMELVDRQTYISWKLPKDWHIVLTSNPDNADYMVQSIDSAQRTRFISTNLEYDVKVWARWAESVQIDGRCINFLLMHPELVKEDTNARSITTFFNSISSFPTFEDNLPMIQLIGQGSVGAEFSTMFTSFINNKLDKLISPEDIIKKDWAHVQAALLNCVGQGDNYRADIGSLMATRVVNYTVNYSESNTIDQKIINNLTNLITEDIFANDLKFYIVKGFVNGNKQKFQKLLMNPEIVKMTVQ